MQTKTDINELQVLQNVVLRHFAESEKLGSFKKGLIRKDSSKYFSGLNSTLKSILVAFLSHGLDKPVVLIAQDVQSALKYQLELSWLTNLPVKYFGSSVSSPYDMVCSYSNVISDQLSCLESLLNKEPSIIICPVKSLFNSYLSPEEFEESSLKLSVSQYFDIEELKEKLINLGYVRTSVIVDPGEFSIRGDICDIYPISSDPVRIEFIYDEIESIRGINVENQRSIKILKEVTIRPKYKIILTEDKRKQLVKTLEKYLLDKEEGLDDNLKDLLRSNLDDIITQINNKQYFDGVEYFAPYVHEKLSTILDYISSDNLVFFDEINDIANTSEKLAEKYMQEYQAGIASFKLIDLPYLHHPLKEQILDFIDNYIGVFLNVFSTLLDSDDNMMELCYRYIPSFLNNLKKAAEFVEDLKKQGYTIIITTEYPQRVKNLFMEWGCASIYLSPDTEDHIDVGDVIISKIGPTNGFILPEFKFAVLTDYELFNKKSKQVTLSKKVSKRENLDYLLSPTDLNEGDYVVHERHGIGKFIQMQKMSIDNQEREYITIEYAKGDKLYVPVDQINLVSRYRGVGDVPPKLNKMGGYEWEKIKNKTSKAVEDIASELLNLYAQRAKLEGYAFDPDSDWQSEMEESFEFVETPDQMSSIMDVKNDMESIYPMDRLICGDVGFGKTEVAIRAVFKAVLSGRQVALLVPTTILAQQHYNTITERFLPYPLKIGMLSRFRTPKQQKETINKLILGECDIVIGTHRLLQKDIAFKNLGLVVIDEEHRFGVKHKEKLKQLRAQVDVISMSATPIPRTLYMALSGIRDMSVINTPPVNRSPIKTSVGEFNKSIVKSAILNEMERNGQIYFVHNRVQSIYNVAHELQELLPEAKIVIGHGQMNEKELETVMLDFSCHKYDILIATTIIESGLDIPNVNTIIIDDADCMGLAQLYQLRGRVGRSDRQSYSYCFYRPNKVLTPEAKKRLTAIKEFNTLGSGYHVALRDLEIRGIGNVLGSKQHGNMVNVGFELYCEMLEDSINKLKGVHVEKKPLPVVDINVTAFLPDNWIGDKEQKVVEYKRLAAVESERELEVLTSEWEDRFGKIPFEVKNLVRIIKIRLLSREIGFNLIREETDFIRILTNYNNKFWMQFTSKIPAKIANKTRWIKMPETSMDGSSAILIKYIGFTPSSIISFVEELCSHLSTYLRDIKGEE